MILTDRAGCRSLVYSQSAYRGINCGIDRQEVRPVSTNRVALLLVVAMFFLWQPVASQVTSTGKYRVKLNTGERFVLTSATLTSDSLTGSKGGVTRSIPCRAIQSLEHSTGDHGGQGAVIGLALGLTGALVSILMDKNDDSAVVQDRDHDLKVLLRLAGIAASGTLVGLSFGQASDRWEPIPWGSVVGGRADSGELKLQFSLRF